MTYLPAILALVFDFDDTLVPDSTTKLLASFGIDTDQFWRVDAQKLVAERYDPPHAYLRLLLSEMGPNGRVGEMSLEDLRAFGLSLDQDFYPGLPDFFDDLREIVAEYRDVSIEFYIISGGLQTVMEGSSIVRHHFAGVYGCLLGEDDTGALRYIKRCVTFTEKTRYLFEINKGLRAADTATNPYLVNKDLPPSERRIPFRNIIYVGDGLTDIPCFSLVKQHGGISFGVFQPGQESSAKKAFLEFLRPARVISMHAPRYGHDDELGSMLRTAVRARCVAIALERNQA